MEPAYADDVHAAPLIHPINETAHPFFTFSGTSGPGCIGFQAGKVALAPLVSTSATGAVGASLLAIRSQLFGNGDVRPPARRHSWRGDPVGGLVTKEWQPAMGSAPDAAFRRALAP